jgi:hypothetical protein
MMGTLHGTLCLLTGQAEIQLVLYHRCMSHDSACDAVHPMPLSAWCHDAAQSTNECCQQCRILQHLTRVGECQAEGTAASCMHRLHEKV